MVKLMCLAKMTLFKSGILIFAENYFQEVLDHETWIFNLTEANQAPDSPVKWFKEYSFKEFYQIPDLSPDTLNDMVTNKWMKQDSLMTRVSSNCSLMEKKT